MDPEPSCFPMVSRPLEADEQLHRLQELKVALNAAKEYNPFADQALHLGDNELKKFLKSCHYDVDIAYERLLGALKFRSEMGIDNMLENPEEFAAQDQWGSAYWHNTDMAGRPVLVLRLCRHDPYRFCADTTTRYLLWKFVDGIKRFESEQVTLLVDYIGATRHNLDMRLLTTIIPTFQSHFPETLGNCFVYPTSFGFWMMWKMFSRMLDEQTASKLVFLRESKRSKLLKFFRPDQLQQRFGGTSPQEYGMEQEGNITGGGVLHGVEVHDGLDQDGNDEEYDRFLQEQEDKAETIRKLLKYKRDCVPRNHVGSVKVDDVNISDLGSSSPDLGQTVDHTSKGEQIESGVDDLIEAGRSLRLVKHDEVAREPKLTNAYSTLDPRVFRVRCGPDYKRNRLKATAKGPTVYDLVAVDIYQCERKVYNIGSHMQVPAHVLPVTKQQSKSGLPELLIINFQMPFYEPPNPVWGTKKDDGQGAFVIHFFRLSEWAAEKPNHPAVKLWSRFVHCHEDDVFRDRMKFILSMTNPEELGLSRVEKALNSKYNAQPFLSRPEACFKGPGYFEMDIDCHKFCYLARKTGYAVLNRVNRMVLNFAAIIQAETNDEMPEGIIATSKLFRLDLKNSARIDIEFAVDGTPSPRKQAQRQCAPATAIYPNPSLKPGEIKKGIPTEVETDPDSCDDMDDSGFHDTVTSH